ncbi:TraB/GumN family protein [Fulvitalea axinellae]
MKKAILCLASLLMLVTTGYSQSVWKVEKGGKVMYLGGTIHMLREQDFPLPDVYDKTLEKSDVIAFEADLDKAKTPDFAQMVMAKCQYSDGRTLRSVLEEDTYTALEAKVESYKLPMEHLTRMKPSMVMIMMMAMEMKKVGIGSKGVDAVYHEKAKDRKLPIKYLETMEEQMDLISKMGEGDEDEFVKYSLEDMKNMSGDLVTMLDEWKAGKPEYFTEKVKEMKSDYPEIYKDLLTDRNNKWLPQLENMMQDEPAEFVLVGVMHMYGNDGLIHQLERKGYKVSQLK